jgi:hypothetical protein
MEREPDLIKVLTTTIEHLRDEIEEVKAKAAAEIKEFDDMITNCKKLIMDSKRRSLKFKASGAAQ